VSFLPEFTIRGLIREQNVPRTPPSTAGTMPRRSGYNAGDALRLTPLGTHPAAGKSVELLVEKYGLTMCGSLSLN